MNPQPALRVLFLRATHEMADNSMILTVQAERLAYAAFAPAAGVPDPSQAMGSNPSVMLLPCEAPRHPEDDGVVMERAAAAFLRTRPASPALFACLRDLIAGVGDMPEFQSPEPTR